MQMAVKQQLRTCRRNALLYLMLMCLAGTFYIHVLLSKEGAETPCDVNDPQPHMVAREEPRVTYITSVTNLTLATTSNGSIGLTEVISGGEGLEKKREAIHEELRMDKRHPDSHGQPGMSAMF